MRRDKKPVETHLRVSVACCDKSKATQTLCSLFGVQRTFHRFIVDQNRSISCFNGLSAGIFNEYLMRRMNIIFSPPKITKRKKFRRIWSWRVNTNNNNENHKHSAVDV